MLPIMRPRYSARDAGARVDNAFLYRFFPGEPCSVNAYLEELAALLPARGKVLDLGCGANTSLARFRTPQREVWGADLQAHSLLEHHEWFRLLGPEETIPFPRSTFDVIGSLWVLEHVRRPAAFLAEVHRVLRPGGWLVAHSVNARHYVTWIRRAFDLLPHALVQRLVRRLYGRDEIDTFPTAYRLNTTAQLRRVARRAGLNLERMRTYSNLGEYFAFCDPLRRLAVMADWLLEKAAPGWGRIYFTALLRKPGSADTASSAGARAA
jgi:SAM-dependent methyltransferase